MTIDRYAAFRQRREKLIQDLGSETMADAILTEEARQNIISAEENIRQASNALYESIRDGLRRNKDTDAISSPVPEPELKKVRRQEYQESEILRVIGDLGHDPKNLPLNSPGKPGVKALVKQRFDWTKSVFSKAWERLSERGVISYS